MEWADALALDGRQLALLVWLGTLSIAVIAWQRGRAGVADVLRPLADPKLLFPLLLLVGWTIGLVVVGRRFRLWEPTLLFDTALWFFATALVIVFQSVERGSREKSFFGRTAAGAFGVMIALEFFMNLYVFHVLVEVLLLPLVSMLTLLAVVAETQERFRSVKKVLDALLAIVGLVLLGRTVARFISEWHELDAPATLRSYVLPIWMTVGLLPFAYLLSLYASYDSAFTWIDFSTKDRRARIRAKIALARCFHLRTRQFGGFHMQWAQQLSSATSVREARRILGELLARRTQQERAKIQAQDDLRRFAGVDGVDDEGRRLDKREFDETRRALRTLGTAQMGWYRNRGGRYRPQLLELLEPQFERYGLPDPHAILLKVSADGQAWWGCRRTISGWWFGIGATHPPPDEWFYDGPEEPEGPPDEPLGWSRWGTDAQNW